MEIIDISGHRLYENKEIVKNLTEFDVQKAKRLIDVYCSSTGTNCVLLNPAGECVYGSKQESDGVCTFCHTLQSTIGMHIDCSSAHKYGIYQSERFEGKYTFFCPVGLVHWASPLLIGEEMKAAFLGGPVLLYDREEFASEVIAKHNLGEFEADRLRSLTQEIPLVDHAKLSSLTEMLYLLSKQISEEETRRYMHQQEEVEKLNEEIKDSLPYLKSMGGSEELPDYPIEKERELLRMISSGDKAGARKVLNDILGHVFFSSSKLEVIKARVLELVVLLSRAALEGGASTEEIFGLNYKYINEIQTFRTVDQLAVWLSKIMVRFSDCVFDLKDVKHVDVIYKALEYIKKNYMNKISLNDVAYVSNISPSYFSKVFKEEMGMNFNNYLNEVRVNNSKRLLMDDAIPLVDVAFMTGFEDQSYFSKVFKRITGVSPGKYRESMGRILEEKTG